MNSIDIEKFNKRITVTPGCWLWIGAKEKKGYGLFSSLQLKAHRVSWMIHNNTDWPATKIARHICNNRNCVNPQHIIPGTSKENAEDREASPIATNRFKPIITPLGNFPSCVMAAKALGISPQLLAHRLKHQSPGYYYSHK
jgi:hypothetical protein